MNNDKIGGICLIILGILMIIFSIKIKRKGSFDLALKIQGFGAGIACIITGLAFFLGQFN